MQFKERLKERMNQKSIDTKEFAKRLYNYGSDSNLWESYEKKSTDIRKIQKWLKGNNEPKNIDELRKICDILDCDFSYLLGDSSIANLNNKKVAEWLGLDEIVVSNIKNYDKNIKLFMSLLVRSNEFDSSFGDILHDIIAILLSHSDNSSNTTVTIKRDLTGEEKVLKGDDAINYIMYDIKNKMEAIFYKVSIIGMEIGSVQRNEKYKEDERKRKEEYEKLMKECIEISGISREEIMKDIEKHKKK